MCKRPIVYSSTHQLLSAFVPKVASIRYPNSGQSHAEKFPFGPQDKNWIKLKSLIIVLSTYLTFTVLSINIQEDTR